MAKIKIALTRLNIRVELNWGKKKKRRKSKKIMREILRRSLRDTITSKNNAVSNN